MKCSTILIVDDDPTILTSLSSLLENHYQIKVANSGERALIVARKKPIPDLILLDVGLNDMSGYAVIEELKLDLNLRDIPVIFVTAKESNIDEEKGLALGASDYIIKPVTPAILLARVKLHIRLKHSSDFLKDNNLFLQKEISRRMSENQLVQDVSIRALAHLAEIRDPETGEHILRTQLYIETIARQLQKQKKYPSEIDDDYISILAKSAPLHDIGKVGIPDNVLLKPGKLNEQEWDIMKTHAILGAQAIELAEKDLNQKVEFLTEAKKIARWHHERWDGKGYPDGLKGDEIPLSAQLMAIADVFDALISKRVYKEPFSFDRAYEIIISEKDKQFSPELISVFDAVFLDFKSIAEKHPPDDAYKT